MSLIYEIARFIIVCVPTDLTIFVHYAGQTYKYEYVVVHYNVPVIIIIIVYRESTAMTTINRECVHNVYDIQYKPVRQPRVLYRDRFNIRTVRMLEIETPREISIAGAYEKRLNPDRRNLRAFHQSHTNRFTNRTRPRKGFVSTTNSSSHKL